ncbi:MAG: sensor histidine kinase, partial [Streptomyces sp.]|nr:sensor histidine kinase [Streptomyces sp.]
MSGFLAGLCVAALPLLAAGFWIGRRTARPESLGGLGTPVEHATFQPLHTSSLAAPPLRACLTEETARRSARRL